MKILITGGAGLIGTEIAHYLNKKHKIYSTYRNSKPKKIKNVIWKKINLEKKIKWNIYPDIIINCTVTSKFSKRNKSQDFINSNIIAIGNILDFAVSKRTKKIINLSTVSVYKLGKNKIINENSEINFYEILAYTKYIGEQIISNSKISFINLRLPSVLNFNLIKNHSWMNTQFQRIKENKKIVVYNGDQKFNSIIHINQLFYLFDKIIKNKKNINGTYNFTPSKSETLKNIIFYVKNFYQSNSKIKFNKNKNITPYISSKKIVNELKLTLPSTFSIIKDSLNKDLKQL